MKLKFKIAADIEANAHEWTVSVGEFVIAGGYGATPQAASNDMQKWLEANVKWLDPLLSFKVGQLVTIRSNGAKAKVMNLCFDTCFRGQLIVKCFGPNGKLCRMNHALQPSEVQAL